MTDEERYAELVADWQEKFDALNKFPLFEQGWMRTERLNEYELLRDAERDARKRKDEFIEAFRNR